MSARAKPPGAGRAVEHVIALVATLVKLATAMAVVYCGLLFASQFWVALYYHMEGLPRPLDPLLAPIRNAVGVTGGVDLAPIIGAALIVAAGILLIALLSAGPSLRRARQLAAHRPPPTTGSGPRAAARLGQGSGSARGDMPTERMGHLDLLEFIAAKKRDIERATGDERKALQASITEAQALLTAKKKPLAFLAADVVGSTRLKADQHSVIIEHAFLVFRRWANGIMERHGVWKSSWTPDGVMAAFRNVSDAAAAAQEILRGLPRFNKEENKMDVPLRLRVGVSQGQVMFDDDARMDEVSDQVIDLAGHLQKYAEPDSLLMARRDHTRLRDRNGFRSTSRQVDGFDVVEWMA